MPEKSSGQSTFFLNHFIVVYQTLIHLSGMKFWSKWSSCLSPFFEGLLWIFLFRCSIESIYCQEHCCHGLTPAGNPAPCRCWLTPPHPEGWGGGSERNVKLKGWDMNSLIGKAKPAHASKAKQGTHSPLPLGRQVSGHPQGSRAPSHVTGTREGKHHNARCPPIPSSSPGLYTQHDILWYGISLCLVWVTSPGRVPSQFLVPLQPFCWHTLSPWLSINITPTTIKNFSAFSTLFSHQSPNTALY